MELTLHWTDDQLEDYALRRLSSTEIPVLEEHLMVCAVCQERLDHIEDFAMGMREALTKSTSQDAVRKTSEFRNWLGGFGFPFFGAGDVKPAFALAFAAVALFVVATFITVRGRTKFAPVASLQLTAIRGEMPLSGPAREIDLTFVDAPTAGGPFRIEVVDGMGNPQWTGVANSGPAGAAVKVQRALIPGDYFVRLYGPDKRVLHEYGFRVRN